MFVSTGNKADVSGNDLLEYLQDDPRTTVIALYLESFGNAQKFVRVASEVGRTKPVVVVKAGWTAAGAQAGQSHTAAAATPAAAVDALLHEAGVLRTDDLPELFDVLALLESGRLPAGPRLAIVGNSGGPGVLAADACSAAGLRLATPGDPTREVLARILPPGVPVTAPVDLRATVTATDFEVAVTAVLQDPAVDAVLTVYTPLVRGAEDDFAEALVRAHSAVPDKLLVASFPGVGWAPAPLQAPGVAIPFFEFPEPAVRSLGKVASYAAWRARPAEPGPAPAAATQAHAAARAIVRAALSGTDDRWLSPQDATALVANYGIACAPVTEAADEDAAVTAAAALGYPVALKAVGPDIVHKSAVGGVLLDLSEPTALKEAFRTLRQRLGAAMTAAAVQPMRVAPPGACELLAGMAVDPELGPLVLAGLGGTLTELACDRVLRMPPRTREAALRQLGELHCATRLESSHGSELAAVADVLVALGRLAEDLPQVREIDINPLLVSAGSIEGLDVRVRVCSDAEGPELPRRALNRPRTAHLEE
jgi:acyl-CoA synthetase (NDP forming)